MPHPHSRLARTTPFPNVLLDEAMPTLNGAQWRLLCVVVRQTLGWQEKGGGRKARDWMTHRQLRQRTGLASASVSHAIDALVRRGLIEVQDASGKLLDSSSARQRAQSALFFSVGKKWLQPGSEAGFSKSGFQKVKTTKETETKEKVVFTKRKAVPIGSLTPSPEVRRFLALYREKQREHRSQDTAVTCVSSDAMKVQELLDRHSFDTLSGLLDAFFASRSHWIVEQRHSLHAFLHSVNVLLLRKSNRASHRRFTRYGN